MPNKMKRVTQLEKSGAWDAGNSNPVSKHVNWDIL